jgi:hypothetical protein
MLYYAVKANVQQGNWNTKPRLNHQLSLVESECDSRLLHNLGAYAGNRMRDGSEFSRCHSSQGAGVMAGAWRRAEHSPRRSLPHFHARPSMGKRGRNQS